MLIARVDTAGRYRFATGRYAALFGLTPREMLGRHVHEVVGQAAYASLAPRIAEVLAGVGVAFEVEMDSTVDGPSIIRAIYEPETDVDGTVIGFIAALTNVTAQRRVEAALRDSEATLRAFYDSAPTLMGVVELLDDGDILHVYDNRASCRFFGVAADQTGGKRATELGATPETIAAWRRRYRESAERGEAVAFDHPFQGPEGVRWLSVSVSLLRAPGAGRPRFCYVADDTTDRKQMEQELAAREEEFRTLADNISQFAWTADADGWIYWYNRRWFDYTGTTISDMAGWGWTAAHHPDHVDRVVAKIRACFASGAVWEDTFPLRARDGSYRWFLSRAIPIRDASGRVLRWFGTNTDITAQRDAEEALRAADRRKDEFLATLAHELRNPLNPIRNAAEILRAKSVDDPDVAWSRDVIHRQVDHLSRLVDDLLDLSRVSRGRLDLRTGHTDLATVVQSAIEASRPVLDERGHQLTVDLPAEGLPLVADEVRLAQVFTNLLNNSAKYTPCGGHVWLAATRAGTEVTVSVRDDGEGIAAAALPHVFDMFNQAAGPVESRSGGLGIGLTLVRRLVELHGGAVSAHSDGPGRGSEFRVRLPLDGRAADGAATPVAPPAAAAEPLRILVADDNDDSAASLAMLLELRGHQVRTAHDGREALALEADFRPHVALLDLGMPGLSGYDVCRELRARPRGAELRLIALTGWGQDDDRRRTREAGFDHHLVKPLAFGELERLLGWTPA